MLFNNTFPLHMRIFISWKEQAKKRLQFYLGDLIVMPKNRTR